MQKKIKRIIDAYYEQYVVPLEQEMYPYGQVPYYPEQETTYTDLSQLDSEHGGLTFQERYPLNYPETGWNNPSWAVGDFRSPYETNFMHLKDSPNDYETLFDPLRGASMIDDLGSSAGKQVDSFLSPPPRGAVKLASIDISEFLKVSDDTLIHKSKQELWKMYKDAEGDIYISRLFDEGSILKD